MLTRVILAVLAAASTLIFVRQVYGMWRLYRLPTETELCAMHAANKEYAHKATAPLIVLMCACSSVAWALILPWLYLVSTPKRPWWWRKCRHCDVKF